MDKQDVELFIEKHEKNKERSSSFATFLYQMMDKYGFDKASDLYNKANISRQPSLAVCIKIVFTLKMTNAECKLLLKEAGYTLASVSRYSLTSDMP